MSKQQPTTTPKVYGRRIVARFGPHLEYTVTRNNDGTFAWSYRGGEGRIPVTIEPTPELWARLALKLTEELDGIRQADEDMVEAWQDAEGDDDKQRDVTADIIRGMAEHAEMRMCGECKRWTNDAHGHDYDNGWFCDGCVDNWDPVCKCGNHGCMRCIGVPSSGPIP